MKKKIDHLPKALHFVVVGNMTIYLEDKNIIGKLADRVYSCMGGVYSQRRVLSEIAPEIYKQFRSQEVDVAMLIPM
mgnify:CR=1 FL=1